MAVTRHTNFDRTVATISERNSILQKVDGMIVVVEDAIADVAAGSGKAVYRWDSTDSAWIMIYKSTYESVSFITEELLISNGKVTASNIPTDGVLWDISVVDGNVQLAIIKLESLFVNLAEISLDSNDYNGKKLRFSYAYGSISQQLDVALKAASDVSIGGY